MRMSGSPQGYGAPLAQAGPTRLFAAAGSWTRSYDWERPQLSAASNTSRTSPTESIVTTRFKPVPTSTSVSPTPLGLLTGPGALGLSTVTETLADCPMLPTASVARTWNEWLPFPTPVESQENASTSAATVWIGEPSR